MSLKNCNISFVNKPLGQFETGETIIGKFNISFQRLKKVKGLKLTVIGETNCHWKAKDALDPKKTKKVFRGYTVHCENHTDLLSNMERVNGLVTLEAGTHSFEFKYKLANNLPASFEGLYGSIRFKILVMKIGEKNSKIFSTIFNVMSKIDLNTLPLYNQPIVKNIPQAFTIFGYPNGHLIITLHIPKSGFASGENITINCFILNESYVKILKGEFSLQQLISYHATSPYGTQKQEEKRIARTIVDISDDQNNIFVALSIPYTVPSIENSNSIIRIQYFIKAKFKTNRLFKTFKTSIPITMGTIPISDPTITSSEQPSTSQSSVYRLSAPPTYSEAIAEPSGSRNVNKRFSLRNI